MDWLLQQVANCFAIPKPTRYMQPNGSYQSHK